MTIAEMIKATTPVAAGALTKMARWGRLTGNVLSFSPADDRIAPGRCLALTLETGGIWVSLGSRVLSRIKITANRFYPFEAGKYPTPENLATTAIPAVNAFKAAGAQVTLVIPKAWVIVKTAEFPLVAKDDLFNVVSYELDRLTPISSDKARFDFRILTEDENRIEILIAAIRTDRINPYLEALRERGIIVTRVAVDLFALGTLSHYLQGGKDTLFAQTHSGGYEGGLIRNGRWKAFLTGSLASGDGPSHIGLAERLKPFVEQVKKERGSPEVFITPPLSTEQRTLLRDRINAPVRSIGERGLRPMYLRAADTQEPSPGVLGGILETLWPRAEGMNLLARVIHKPQAPMALTIVLLTLLIASCLFWLVSPLQIQEKRIEAIDREIAARGGEIKKIEALQKDLEGITGEIATINDFRASHPMILNLLKEMTLVLPGNVWLSRARITESTVELEGYAASATDVVPKLEASGYFKKVEFASPTFRDVRLNADRFLIKLEIEAPRTKR